MRNETLDETLLDIANYARYTWAMRRLALNPDKEVGDAKKTGG